MSDSAIYLNGVKIGTGKVQLIFPERDERPLSLPGTVTIPLRIEPDDAARMWAAMDGLYRRSYRGLRYQMKRKGKPGWRYIRVKCARDAR